MNMNSVEEAFIFLEYKEILFLVVRENRLTWSWFREQDQ